VPRSTLPANEDALNQLRRELEIERIEVDRWKKDQERQIAEQRHKVQEAEHSLLEEKIRFGTLLHYICMSFYICHL
jgi:hypothetical protein